MICDVCNTEQKKFKTIAWGGKVCFFCWLKGWINVIQKNM